MAKLRLAPGASGSHLSRTQQPLASPFSLPDSSPPPLSSSPHPTPDEFGNRFEVNNCSICYHWVTAEPQEPVVFSADYKGCHVLEKVGTTHCPGKEPHGQVPAWPNAVSGWGGLSWTRDTRAPRIARWVSGRVRGTKS